MIKNIFILLIILLSSTIHSRDLVLVTSLQSDIVSINKQDLKKFYIGKMTTLNGIYFKPTIQSDDNLHKNFLESFLNINPRQFARTWQKQVFTGKAQMPKKLSNSTELKDLLSHHSDYVGYMYEDMVDASVRVIKVEDQ